MKKEAGITLISLVITVIILIILAGISINMILGEDRLIKRAQQAKLDTINATIESEEKLNVLVDEMNKQLLGENGEEILTVEKVKNNGNYVQGNTQIKDNKGNKVVIPDGFKIAEDSGLNVSEGIVIEDNEATMDGNGNLRGNQFVWVPVSNLGADESNQIIKTDGTKVQITLGRYSFSDDGSETLVQKAENYIEETLVPNYFKELTIARISNGISGLNGNNTTAKDLKGFIDSVEQNGGYYIARYEASYRDGTKPYSKVSLTATTSSTQTDGKLWNNITQVKAAEVSRVMYRNLNFTTDLINSYAWDTAISYIQKCSENTNYSKQNPISTSIVNTGKNGDEVCKIHDMASNMLEWTTEYSTFKNSSYAYPCVYRGGIYGVDVSTAGGRIDNITSYASENVSFRVMLYM